MRAGECAGPEAPDSKRPLLSEHGPKALAPLLLSPPAIISNTVYIASLVCLCTCLEPLLAIAAEAHNIAGSAENRISRSTGSAQTSGSAQNIATAQWLCMLVLPWCKCMLLVSDIQASNVWCMRLLLCTPIYIT